jgi:ATP-dependent Clp protease adaptor protein ClpS
MEAIRLSNENAEFQEGVATEIQEKIEEPPMYKVLLHNDDYTTKEFVVGVLMTFFDKSIEEATRLMWHIHKNGIGVCGTFIYEVAETKVNQVTVVSRENGFPLRTTMEPDE